ncbi:MAG: cytochrome c [Gemmatimonadota bacterium]|jgi:mono/diheme cytochrome c family protein
MIAKPVPKVVKDMRVVVATLTVVGLTAFASQSTWAQALAGPTQSATAGARVFGAKGCVRCHSIDGQGGTGGPDLGRALETRSLYDLAADMWNHVPEMFERMQQLGIGWPTLNREESGDLVAFLFTIDYFDPAPDTENGQRLFFDKRCVLCHQVGRVGGVVGPNLDYFAEYGSPIQIASAMWNHGPAMSEILSARGVERPTFTGSQLIDLIGYIGSNVTTPLDQRVAVLPGRADEGRTLFTEKRCVQCHSIRGQGGRVAPDLAGQSAHRSLTEFAAAMWNKQPAMLATMRAREISVPQLQPEEMADLVAYLYSVRYFAGSGTSQLGRTRVRQKGCLACHSLGGSGGTAAPDLAGIAPLGSPAEVISVLWNHALIDPDSADQRHQWPTFSAAEMADLAAFLQSAR